MTTAANCADPALYEVREHHTFSSLDTIRFKLDDDDQIWFYIKNQYSTELKL